MINQPHLWPWRPWLPLKSREIEGADPKLGVLHEQYGPCVFLFNLFELGVTIRSHANLLDQQSIPYASFAHLEEEWDTD